MTSPDSLALNVTPRRDSFGLNVTPRRDSFGLNVTPRRDSERRLAPRFPIHGPVAVRFPGSETAEFLSAIFDISLNGALLSVESANELQLAELKTGAAIEVELSLQGVPHVLARATIAHVHVDRFGIEFSDMETRDFDVFAGLVLMLEQRNRINLIDAS